VAIVESLLDLVGNTSLLKLNQLPDRHGASVWVKLEQQNPGGSLKDRVVLAMIDRAEREKKLKPGGTVIEPTSGNTGISLAIACAVRGYKLVLTMPESMSLERRALLQAYGATLHLTPADQQMAGAIALAERLVAENEGAWMPSQFANPANPDAHEHGTAVELINALAALDVNGSAPSRGAAVPPNLAAMVLAVGTGGTITGVGRAFSRLSPSTRIVGVEPESCATISRGERGPSKIQGIAAGFVPANYDPTVVHEIRTISDQRAWDCKLSLAQREGLLVGISSGANVAVALELAATLPVDQHVVTLLCDTGERYFSLASFFTATGS
jgi:cysteine synthase A